MYDKIRIIRRISKRWDWLLSALLGLATTRTKCAPLNASPHCSPQGHCQRQKSTLLAMISFLYTTYQTSLRRYIIKKVAQFTLYDFSTFGWKMGFEPTTFGTTIRHSNRLSYIHHIRLDLSNRCANIEGFGVFSK